MVKSQRQRRKPVEKTRRKKHGGFLSFFRSLPPPPPPPPPSTFEIMKNYISPHIGTAAAIAVPSAIAAYGAYKYFTQPKLSIPPDQTSKSTTENPSILEKITSFANKILSIENSKHEKFDDNKIIHTVEKYIEPSEKYIEPNKIIIPMYTRYIHKFIDDLHLNLKILDDSTYIEHVFYLLLQIPGFLHVISSYYKDYTNKNMINLNDTVVPLILNYDRNIRNPPIKASRLDNIAIETMLEQREMLEFDKNLNSIDSLEYYDIEDEDDLANINTSYLLYRFFI
jgi:hypothetical protein